MTETMTMTHMFAHRHTAHLSRSIAAHSHTSKGRVRLHVRDLQMGTLMGRSGEGLLHGGSRHAVGVQRALHRVSNFRSQILQHQTGVTGMMDIAVGEGGTDCLTVVGTHQRTGDCDVYMYDGNGVMSGNLLNSHSRG